MHEHLRKDLLKAQISLDKIEKMNLPITVANPE